MSKNSNFSSFFRFSGKFQPKMKKSFQDNITKRSIDFDQTFSTFSKTADIAHFYQFSWNLVLLRLNLAKTRNKKPKTRFEPVSKKPFVTVSKTWIEPVSKIPVRTWIPNQIWTGIQLRINYTTEINPVDTRFQIF